MKTFTNLKDLVLSDVDSAIIQDVLTTVHSDYGESIPFSETYALAKAAIRNEDVAIKYAAYDFIGELGGDIFVIEDVKELNDVKLTTRASDGEWVSMAATELPFVYDVFEAISENIVVIINVDNNGGGPSYYVPKDILLQSSVLVESFEMTTAHYKEQRYD